MENFFVNVEGFQYDEDVEYLDSDIENDNPSTHAEIIWTSRHATHTDRNATAAFIGIVASYQEALNDKKSRKLKVWEQIANDLEQMGYRVAPNLRDGGLKCHQKWRNLEKTYLQFVKQMNQTGAEGKKQPLFYNELHGVLSSKHRIIPPFVVDSIPSIATYEVGPECTASPLSPVPSSSSSSKSETSSIFTNVLQSTKARNTKQDIIDAINSANSTQERMFECFEKTTTAIVKNSTETAQNCSDMVNNCSEMAKSSLDMAQTAADFARNAAEMVRVSKDMAKSGAEMAKHTQDLVQVVKQQLYQNELLVKSLSSFVNTHK